MKHGTREKLLSLPPTVKTVIVLLKKSTEFQFIQATGAVNIQVMNGVNSQVSSNIFYVSLQIMPPITVILSLGQRPCTQIKIERETVVKDAVVVAVVVVMAVISITKPPHYETFVPKKNLMTTFLMRQQPVKRRFKKLLMKEIWFKMTAIVWKVLVFLSEKGDNINQSKAVVEKNDFLTLEGIIFHLHHATNSSVFVLSFPKSADHFYLRPIY